MEVQTSGPENLWTCGFWVVDRISIMYVAGYVDPWNCGGPVGCGQNIYHVCSGRCGPVDLRTCEPVDLFM